MQPAAAASAPALSPGASPGPRSGSARSLARSPPGACANPLPSRPVHEKRLALAIAALFGGCATPPPPAPPQTLNDYKLGVAKRIVAGSRDTYATPVPEMLKSIVVLEITLDK